jgi:DegV family protein with EDD domain
MGKVAIITDSASCLPLALREKYAIAAVPLSYQFGASSYLDNVSLTADEFYALLKTSRRLPTTAAPGPGVFLEAFRQAHRRGAQEMLCIVTDSTLTGTYGAACQGAELAQKELPDARIRVLDSRCAAASLGFVVLAAVRAAESGAALGEATAAALDLVPHLHMIGMLDTLEYLAKGGRVPRVTAWLSSLVQMKPLFEFHDGQVSQLGAVRTRRRALARLLELMRRRLSPGKPLHVAIFHTRSPQEAEQLADQVQQEFQPVELYVTEFSQVMSIHSGPGLVGLAFYSEP